MYKNIEILNKEKFKNLKFDNIDAKEVGKNIGLIPLGFTEIWSASHDMPIIISAGDNAEFVAFCGINLDITIFNKEEVYLPAFIKTYPFLNVEVENKEKKLNSLIAIDNNPKCVAKDKKFFILDKEKNLSKEVATKVELIKELNSQRAVCRRIIAELKKLDLLIKKDLRVNFEGKKEKIILEEFYIINIEKLLKLEDKIVASFAKKGWMGIFDAHLKSISNFEKVLKANKTNVK